MEGTAHPKSRHACGRVAPWSARPRNAVPGNLGVVAGRRYYSPGIGRWTSRDPSEEGRGGTNLQAFVGNDPATRHDYLGLWPWTGCCDGQAFNRLTHCCCCGGTPSGQGGPGCNVLSRLPQDTGIRMVCLYESPFSLVFAPKHCYIEAPGLMGGSAGFYATGIRSPEQPVYANNTPGYDRRVTTIGNLSPCSFNLKAMRDFIKAKVGEPPPWYNVYTYNCRHWAMDMLGGALNAGKGACGL